MSHGWDFCPSKPLALSHPLPPFFPSSSCSWSLRHLQDRHCRRESNRRKNHVALVASGDGSIWHLEGWSSSSWFITIIDIIEPSGLTVPLFLAQRWVGISFLCQNPGCELKARWLQRFLRGMAPGSLSSPRVLIDRNDVRRCHGMYDQLKRLALGFLAFYRCWVRLPGGAVPFCQSLGLEFIGLIGLHPGFECVKCDGDSMASSPLLPIRHAQCWVCVCVCVFFLCCQVLSCDLNVR